MLDHRNYLDPYRQPNLFVSIPSHSQKTKIIHCLRTGHLCQWMTLGMFLVKCLRGKEPLVDIECSTELLNRIITRDNLDVGAFQHTEPAREVRDNRSFVVPNIDTILTCVIQNLSCRGHGDGGPSWCFQFSTCWRWWTLEGVDTIWHQRRETRPLKKHSSAQQVIYKCRNALYLCDIIIIII